MPATRAEIHAQTALNLGPCPRDCMFRAFACSNGVFTEEKEFLFEYVLDTCLQFEADGANAVVLMTTGTYPLGKFLEAGAAAREKLKEDTLFLANVGDFGAAAGANLMWAEVGANPRDTAERTEEGRGMSVPEIAEVYREAEWDVLDGPSVYYRKDS